MAVTVLTSASGAPGVTTTALGLTLFWPDSCLLVDADYQQAVLAGYLRGGYLTPNSIVHVINAARISPDVREAVWRQSVPLPEDDPDGIRRLFLPGLVSAQAADALRQSWTPIAAALRDLDDAGIDIVIDFGRLTPAGLPPALWDAASQVLLMARPTMRSVGACHWAAQRLAEQSLASGTNLGLILVRPPALTPAALTGAGRDDRGYSNSEIEEFLPLKVRDSVLQDPVNARLLSDGGHRGPKFTKSGYASSLSHLAQSLRPRPGQTIRTSVVDGGEDL